MSIDSESTSRSTQQFELLRSALLLGAPGGLETGRALLEHNHDVDAPALALGLEFAAYWIGASVNEPVTPQAVEALAGRGMSSDALLTLLCVAGARGALMRFDRAQLARWLGVYERLSCQDLELQVRYDLGAAWFDFMSGHLDDAVTRLERIKVTSRTLQIGDCLVEAEAGLALTSLVRGDLSDAVETARSASRMARTEALPQQELFANLVLARVRRVSGSPYLASRILDSLTGLAPLPWRSWLVWEQLLAGAANLAIDLPRSLASRASEAVNRLLEHARAGRRERFDESVGEVAEALVGFAPLAWEFHDTLICMDYNRPFEQGSEVAANWVTGRDSSTPHGLHGLVATPGEQRGRPQSVGYVVLAHGAQARRTLSPGVALILEPDTVVIDRQHRPQVRTHTALAALALSPGRRADEREFFANLYGFAYDHVLHKHVLDMLVSRARTMLGSGGTIQRGGGELRLEPSKPLVLWDPRCEPPFEDRILSILAQGEPKTAKDTAGLLNIPLRTVQTALKDLTETGGCVPQRDGRNIVYTIEDTTFSEPTLSRFRHDQ